MDQQIRFYPNNPILGVLLSFWHWRKLWIGTTVAFAVLGLFYAIALKTDTWVATQGLVVRDEASGGVMRLGRFESQTQMKAAQEMVLEMASSPQVVGKAMSVVGRPAKLFGLIQGSPEFSSAEIESFGKNCVSVRAPRGAELGTTEVIYLEVKDKSQERAMQLAAAICDSLELQLQEVRRTRAQGIIQELEAALSVSEAELARSTDKLKNLELQAGVDLVDLRGLTDSNSGSTNRLMLDLVRDDLRKCELEMQLHRENLDAVQLGLRNPDLLMQITDRLVDSQPTIKKLREGLSEARLRTAQLQGRFSDSHADVRIAKLTEQRFRENLLQELSNSEQAILGAIEYCEMKTAKLNEQESALGRRLNLLADIRADYTNALSEVKSNSEEVQQIRREQTQAMAAKNAASSSSLITRVSTPQLGDRPLGPGRTTIVGGSLIGGLFLGLGLAFLLTPLGGLSHSPISPNGRAKNHPGNAFATPVNTTTGRDNPNADRTDQPACSQERQYASTDCLVASVDDSTDRAIHGDLDGLAKTNVDIQTPSQSFCEGSTSSPVEDACSNESVIESLVEWEERLRAKFTGPSIMKKSKELDVADVQRSTKADPAANGGINVGAKPNSLGEIQAIIAKAMVESQTPPAKA